MTERKRLTYYATMETQSVKIDVRINRDIVELLLIAYGITKLKVAETAGVNKFTVAKVIHNRHDVGPEKRMAVLRAIAALTGRDPETLVMGRLVA